MLQLRAERTNQEPFRPGVALQVPRLGPVTVDKPLAAVVADPVNSRAVVTDVQLPMPLATSITSAPGTVE